MNEEQSQICSKCNLVKNFDEFYFRKRRQSNTKVRLKSNMRNRINKALKNKSKGFKAKEILGIDLETYKFWIEYQMSAEMNWTNIHIDHVKPISSFDVSNENELLEAFNWKNTQPLLKEENLRKSNKFNELEYHLQFVKAEIFLELHQNLFNYK